MGLLGFCSPRMKKAKSRENPAGEQRFRAAADKMRRYAFYEDGQRSFSFCKQTQWLFFHFTCAHILVSHNHLPRSENHPSQLLQL